MTQMKIPLKLRVELDKEEVKRYFEQHKRLQPVRFGYTIDYAESLEYGTGPLRFAQRTVKGGNYTYQTIYKAIYEWAGRKDSHGGRLPIKDEEERADFARKVTQDFFDKGMKPHPYFRPAIQWLEANEQILFDRGYSLFEICDEAMRISDKCIKDQNLPFSGKLQQSAFCDTITMGEIKDGSDLSNYHDDERNKWDARWDRVGWK